MLGSEFPRRSPTSPRRSTRRRPVAGVLTSGSADPGCENRRKRRLRGGARGCRHALPRRDPGRRGLGRRLQGGPLDPDVPNEPLPLRLQRRSGGWTLGKVPAPPPREPGAETGAGPDGSGRPPRLPEGPSAESSSTSMSGPTSVFSLTHRQGREEGRGQSCRENALHVPRPGRCRHGVSSRSATACP